MSPTHRSHRRTITAAAFCESISCTARAIRSIDGVLLEQRTMVAVSSTSMHAKGAAAFATRKPRAARARSSWLTCRAQGGAETDRRGILRGSAGLLLGSALSEGLVMPGPASAKIISGSNPADGSFAATGEWALCDSIRYVPDRTICETN